MIGILPGTTFGLADTVPVGSSIAGSFEEVTFNEGFYHMDRMCIFCNPILFDAAHDGAKNMATEMWNMHLGKDQETCIIGEEVDVFSAGFAVPSNKGIPWSGLPCSRTKEKACYILTGFIPNQILNIFTNSSVKPKVMMAVQIIAYTVVLI